MAAAEPDDGGLAGAAVPRNLGECGVRRLPRVRQNPASDLLLGGTQIVFGTFDLAQHVVKLQQWNAKKSHYRALLTGKVVNFQSREVLEWQISFRSRSLT